MRGGWRNDLTHGRGKITFMGPSGPDGRVYEGELRDGQVHGQGTVTYPDGMVTRGEFRGFASSQGTVTFPDGTVYEGELHGESDPWNFGLPHGRGKATFPDGIVIRVDFRAGRPHDRGTAIYPDGTVIKRKWHNGKIMP